MSERFRTETILYKGDKIDISFVPIKDIFKYNDTPYLAVGQSTNGKTTFCIDIIHKFASGCSKIYYVSATDEMVADNAITTIPNVFKRRPTFEQLDNIWKEIKKTTTLANKTRNDYLNLLKSIYPQEQLKLILNKFESYLADLNDELKQQGHSNMDIPNEIDVISIEILTRLILNGINLYGDEKLTNDELLFIQLLVSTDTKTILIIDDVSAELNRLKMSSEKVVYEDEHGETNMLQISKAYKTLLTDIFTKARRYNCILCMFVHTWEIIDVKDQIKNFIIVDEKSATDIKRYRSVSNERVKSIIDTIKNTVYNKYKYHVIVVKDSDVMITKADLNYGNKLELDNLNNKYVEAYEKVTSGANIIINTNEDDSIDEYYHNNIQQSEDDIIEEDNEENKLNDIIEI